MFTADLWNFRVHAMAMIFFSLRTRSCSSFCARTIAPHTRRFWSVA